MRRVYISYASTDRDAALYVTTHLRGIGIDTFYDPERTIGEGGSFSRRLQSEITRRGCVVLIQSPEGLQSALVQAELEFAYRNQVEIIPLALKPLNVRETGEYRFLLNLKAVDFSEWLVNRKAKAGLKALEARLSAPETNRVITVQTVANLIPAHTLQGHMSWVRRVSFSPDGTLLASSANDNTVCLWDVRSADRSGTAPGLFAQIAGQGGHDKLVWGLEFAPRHALLATAAGDSTVRLWDLNSLPTPYEFTRFTDHKHPVYALGFSPDGSLLASGGHDTQVIIRDVRNIDVTGRASASITLLHTAQVYHLTFSPDNRLIATASRDSVVRIWSLDYPDLNEIAKARPYLYKGNTSWVNAVAFAPNSLLIASAGNDSTIRLWDLATSEEIAILTGHTDAVNTLAFSADGSLLASAAKDDTVRLWDMNTLRPLTILRGHQSGVNTVTFSPDGTRLVTGSGDTTIKIWMVGDLRV